MMTTTSTAESAAMSVIVTATVSATYKTTAQQTASQWSNDIAPTMSMTTTAVSAAAMTATMTASMSATMPAPINNHGLMTTKAATTMSTAMTMILCQMDANVHVFLAKCGFAMYNTTGAQQNAQYEPLGHFVC